MQKSDVEEVVRLEALSYGEHHWSKESFYNETKRYVSKENVRERIEHLRKTGVLERFSNIYATQKSKATPLLVITKIGSIENPNISKYIVNEEEIIGIRVFYNYMQLLILFYSIEKRNIRKGQMFLFYKE